MKAGPTQKLRTRFRGTNAMAISSLPLIVFSWPHGGYPMSRAAFFAYIGWSESHFDALALG